MRTTLDLDERLIAKARVLAAEHNTSLTRLIEEGLALRLRPAAKTVAAKRIALPVYRGRGGLTARVKNPSSTRALMDAADGD